MFILLLLLKITAIKKTIILLRITTIKKITTIKVYGERKKYVIKNHDD